MRRAVVFVLACLSVAACSSSDGSDSSVATTLPAATTVATSASTATNSTVTSDPAATEAATSEPATTEPATIEPATTEQATTEPATTEPATTEPATTEPATTEPAATEPADSVPADRPFDLFVPAGYDAGVATPLVLLLHGYSASGDIQEAYFGLQPLAEERGFLYAHPDGTVNAIGNKFWNATNACCGFNSSVDDTAYLMSIIHQVERDYNVDRRRIFLIGHSNGGFMSYRMACDHAETIAAIVSLAGATFADTSQCSPSEPVSVLEVHGTADETISYDGGEILGQSYPAAPVTTATWATYDGCSPTPVASAERVDIAAQVDGAETEVGTYGGCPTGIDVELWTVAGAQHAPALTPDFATGAIDFLLGHPKP